MTLLMHSADGVKVQLTDGPRDFFNTINLRTFPRRWVKGSVYAEFLKQLEADIKGNSGSVDG